MNTPKADLERRLRAAATVAVHPNRVGLAAQHRALVAVATEAADWLATRGRPPGAKNRKAAPVMAVGDLFGGNCG